MTLAKYASPVGFEVGDTGPCCELLRICAWVGGFGRGICGGGPFCGGGSNGCFHDKASRLLAMLRTVGYVSGCLDLEGSRY